jgi:hypothetical protein
MKEKVNNQVLFDKVSPQCAMFFGPLPFIATSATFRSTFASIKGTAQGYSFCGGPGMDCQITICMLGIVAVAYYHAAF